MKVLIIDPHRSEFFWQPISNALRKASGWNIKLSKNVPIDICKYDVVLVVYLAEVLTELSRNDADLKLIGVCMGTDACVGSHQQIDSRKVHTIITFNDHHQDILKPFFKFSKVERLTWPADDLKLAYKERAYKSGDKIRLLNIALHQYSKGLDNLIQHLQDVGKEIPGIELHVIGGVGPYGDYNQYLNYYVQWFTSRKEASFEFFYNGEIHPQKIDTVIESINPHVYITASQGEQGATTVCEALIKGFKAVVQDHPFASGLYKDFVVVKDGSTLDYEKATTKGLYFYNTASELKAALNRALMGDSYQSTVYRNYGLQTFGMNVFIQQLIDVIKEVKDAPVSV